MVGDGRNGRLDNFQRVTVWSAKGKSGHRVLAGQDKGQRAQLERFVDAVRTAPRCRSRWSPWSRRPAQRLPSGQFVLKKAGCLVSRPSAGWYIRRLRGMSPTEVFYRTLDAGRRRTWARRQVQPSDVGRHAARHPCGPGFRVAAAGVDTRRCRSGSASAVIRAADTVLDGTWTVLGVRRSDSADPDWFRDPVTGRRAPMTGWPSASTIETRPRPATSSRSGRCPGIITSLSSRPPGG